MDYAAILAVAQELIADAGRVVTWERLTTTPADSDKPWKGAASPTVEASAALPAAFVPPQGADLGGMRITDEMLGRVERVALVAASAAFDLSRTTSATDGGERWRADWVAELKPGDTAVLYAIGLCR